MSSKTKSDAIDLQSIVSRFSEVPEEDQNETSPSIVSLEEIKDNKNEGFEMDSKEEKSPEELQGQGRLWNEFIGYLNDNDMPDENTEHPSKSRRYDIDDDIVETLHECNFGKSNTDVINSILRAFLVDNLENLREVYRPKKQSLFDKYGLETR